jgi:hypothetical protein
MTDFEKLLRAGLQWRDARRAVFGQLSHWKRMDEYAAACDALEEAVNAISPVGDKTTKPVSLEEELEKSVAPENRKLNEEQKARRRRHG